MVGLRALMGLVVAAHGRHVVVESAAGERLLCHPRSKKNECVVGDHVLWARSADAGVVEHLQSRRNVFYRQDEWRSKRFAANLDQLVLMLAAEPLYSDAWLTRCLIAAASADLPVLIVLNKADLAAQHQAAWKRLTPYRTIGYAMLPLDLHQTQSCAASVPAPAVDIARPAALTAALQGKISLVLGPSGTGKSSLINMLLPHAASRTAALSTATLSGRHTTTHSTWYWLGADRSAWPQGTAIIDSPGFQDFGLQHIAKPSLAACFIEMRTHLGQCRFYNCNHIHEPGCAIQAQVGQSIDPLRYVLYRELWAQAPNA